MTHKQQVAALLKSIETGGNRQQNVGASPGVGCAASWSALAGPYTAGTVKEPLAWPLSI